LKRDANRVYAGTRQPLDHPDERVTPLTLDVTSTAQTQAAAGSVRALDILINNAGLAFYDDLSARAALDVLSDTAFAALPIIPAYSISKAGTRQSP
jgi:NAD(P)-dependent dehydrogenase (short-subunit alcohol dehydrogenase family)